LDNLKNLTDASYSQHHTPKLTWVNKMLTLFWLGCMPAEQAEVALIQWLHMVCNFWIRQYLLKHILETAQGVFHLF
jgi:Mg2+/citrate symporter